MITFSAFTVSSWHTLKEQSPSIQEFWYTLSTIVHDLDFKANFTVISSLFQYCFLIYYCPYYCWKIFKFISLPEIHAYCIKWHRTPQLLFEEWSICNTLFSDMLNLLHSNTNQQLVEKLLCNQSNHYKNVSIVKGSHHMPPPNWHLLLLTKMNGTQRRTLVSAWRIHCLYCGMPKGTVQAEAMSNSEKIKPVALVLLSYVALKTSVS